jgi:RNA polymerase-binding protein DksA
MVARRSAARTPAAADETTESATATGKRRTAGREQTSAEGEAPAKSTRRKTTSAPKKTESKKSTAKKSTAKKSAAKSAAGKSAASEGADRQTTAKKQTTGADKVAAKKTPVAKAEKVPTARAVAAPAEPGELAVRAGEEPWTPQEVEDARGELQSEAQRLRDELVASGEALDGLMRDSGDGAGDDDADTGTKNITREHEMALAANAREMLYQTERAIDRLDAGTYGLCESCGNPIGKARMQAFPRATLCVECKQQQERR